MYFYKYSKVDALSISMLRHGEVFFASPNELNDIYECKPQFIFSADSEIWSIFIHDVLKWVCINLNLQPDSQLARKIISFQINMLNTLLNKRKTKTLDYQSMLNQLTNTFETNAISELTFIEARNAMRALNSYLQNDFEMKLNETYYMTSFSKGANNLTMWGHYGNAEKGFAIIYESVDGKVNLESNLDLFPACEKTSEWQYTLGTSKFSTAPLIEVAYKNKPVRANGFKILIPKFSYSAQQDHYDYPQELLSRIPSYNECDIGHVKFSDWKYERELRLHLPVYEEISATLRSVKISTKHIKGIIFGSKTTQHDKQNILAACYHLKQTQCEKLDLFVFQASPMLSQYKINVSIIGKIHDIQRGKSSFLEKIAKNDIKLFDEAKKIAEAINTCL